MIKCIKCKRGIMKIKDYGFMYREICPYCGYTHDTPKQGKEQEYDEWMRAKNEEYFKVLEGE